MHITAALKQMFMKYWNLSDLEANRQWQQHSGIRPSHPRKLQHWSGQLCERNVTPSIIKAVLVVLNHYIYQRNRLSDKISRLKFWGAAGRLYFAIKQW